MSILIKCMEMPTDGCKDCIFVNRKWFSDVCPFLKIEVTGNVERGGFQTDCPLVPVPPHGRLIDADAMIEKYNSLPHRYDRSMVGMVSNCDLFDALVYDLRKEPTIIPAEESEDD